MKTPKKRNTSFMSDAPIPVQEKGLPAPVADTRPVVVPVRERAEIYGKIAITLEPGQIEFLDRTTAEIQRAELEAAGRTTIDRSKLIQAILKAVERGGFSFVGLDYSSLKAASKETAKTATKDTITRALSRKLKGES